MTKNNAKFNEKLSEEQELVNGATTSYDTQNVAPQPKLIKTEPVSELKPILLEVRNLLEEKRMEEEEQWREELIEQMKLELQREFNTGSTTLREQITAEVSSNLTKAVCAFLALFSCCLLIRIILL